MSDELDKRLRENTARRLHSTFLEGATRRLDRPVDTIVTEPISQTTFALDRFGLAREQVVQNCTLPGRYCLTTFDRSALVVYAEQLVQILPDCNLLFFLEDSRLCGTIHTTRYEVLSRLSLLLDRMDEDVLVGNFEGSEGGHGRKMEQ